MRRWNRHQPAQAQPRLGGNEGRQRVDVRRRAAMLARLVVDVDLQQDVERRRRRGPVARERGDQLRPVHRLHPVEAARRDFGLVRLQVPDQVPLDAAAAWRLLFPPGFLHVVLAERRASAR